MSKLSALLIPMLFLTACASTQNEGKAAAILDAAVPESIAHAKTLTGADLEAIRKTGLDLIATVNCWPSGCGAS